MFQRPLQNGLHRADRVLERLDEVVAGLRQPRRHEGREQVPRADEGSRELGNVDANGLTRTRLCAGRERDILITDHEVLNLHKVTTNKVKSAIKSIFQSPKCPLKTAVIFSQLYPKKPYLASATSIS